MSLSQKIKYEPSITFDEISPKGVILMLREIRSDVSELEPSFVDLSLRGVLDIVFGGQYEIKSDDGVRTVVDLSDAARIVNNYKSYSERGCMSCTSLRGINSQGVELSVNSQADANSFWHCSLYERDPDKLRGEINRTGFSPMVRQYLTGSCESWTPKFSPKIEELVEMEESVNSKRQ